MEISKEIKALLLMQACEISDGVYPTVSSHGDYARELEEQVKEDYENKCDQYLAAFAELEYLN